MSYANVLRPPATPTQREQAHPAQARNNAGGYSFKVDIFSRLTRFLILGSDGGTYYVKARKATDQNLEVVRQCMEENAARTVALIADVAKTGRSYRADSYLLALAYVAAKGAVEARKLAYDALLTVAEIGTNLFKFNEYFGLMKGKDLWGHLRRVGIGNWYNDRPVSQLAYQVIKYQSRQGWSHKDLLNLAHPHPGDDVARNLLYKYITWGTTDGVAEHESLRLVTAWEGMKKATSKEEAIKLINDNRLTWEFVTTNWLGDPDVWAALLPNLPPRALLRNLSRMSANGLIPALGTSDAVNYITRTLGDPVAVKRARIHPMAALVASRVYAQGHSEDGKSTWIPNGRIMSVLEDLFALSFGNVEAANKRTLIGLDVSGSMSQRFDAHTPLECNEAAAALAVQIMRTEPDSMSMAFHTGFVPAGINAKTSLLSAMLAIKNLNAGGTDCALPMIWAAQNKVPVDTFVVITDNETYAGRQHPHVALEEYRQAMSIDACLVVMGMTSTGFSIANPDDKRTLDVVGFDTDTPQVLSQFSKAAI